MEASNLSDRDFRIMIIRILNSLKKRHRTIKKDELEIKNVVSGINNTGEGINGRLHEAEYQTNDLEDKIEKKKAEQ